MSEASVSRLNACVTAVGFLATLISFWWGYRTFYGDFADLKASLAEVRRQGTFAVATPPEGSLLKLEKDNSVYMRGYVTYPLPAGKRVYGITYQGGKYYIAHLDPNVSSHKWFFQIYPNSGNVLVHLCVADEQGRKWIDEWKKREGNNQGSSPEPELPSSVEKMTMFEYTCCTK